MFEPVDHYDNVIRKARKHHQCYECGGWIQPKESYHVRTYLFDGYWHTERVCSMCNKLYHNAMSLYGEDGPAFGGLKGHLWEEQDDNKMVLFMINALERGSTLNFVHWFVWEEK